MLNKVREIPRVGSPRLFEPGMVVDLFAGGGGASIGIEQAFAMAGIPKHVDVAINHDADAIACHARNHPLTEHLQSDVFDVDPEIVTEGRRVRLLWGSPDCTDFSKAKGGKPNRSVKRRSLAWVIVRWAFAVKPDVIMLENVEEFEQWGLLDEDGLPIRDGACFRAWVDSLKSLGYAIEWRTLLACDYGAPTTRKRLFVIARCDGRAIVWPEPTHGDSNERAANGHRSETETNDDNFVFDAPRCINFAVGNTDRLDGGSNRGRVGKQPEQAKTSNDGKSRLTPYRTAAEIIDWSEPMLSIFATPQQAKAWARAHGRHAPRRPLADNTMRRIANGVMRYMVRAERPFILRTGGWWTSAESNEFRGQSVAEPLGTITAGYHNKALVTPIIQQVQHSSSAKGVHGGDEPMPTVTATPKGGGHALVSAFLSKHYGGVVGHGLDQTLGTVTTVDHHSVVAAFLAKYYGNDEHGQAADEPLHTVPTVERFGLVTVMLDGEPWAVVDIAMRMLTPRELARAQGFQDDYVIDEAADGRRLSKRAQVRLIGNSVCPPMSRALVGANVVPGWNEEPCDGGRMALVAEVESCC